MYTINLHPSDLAHTVAESRELFTVTGIRVRSRAHNHRVVKYTDGHLILKAQPTVIALHATPGQLADVYAGSIAHGDTIEIDGTRYIVTPRDLADPELIPAPADQQPDGATIPVRTGTYVSHNGHRLAIEYAPGRTDQLQAYVDDVPVYTINGGARDLIGAGAVVSLEALRSYVDAQNPACKYVTFGYATRVTMHEAKRHFNAGGTVLVSEYGDKTQQGIGRLTTVHTAQSITWDELATLVRDGRSRYPNQRFYTVPAGVVAAQVAARVKRTAEQQQTEQAERSGFESWADAVAATERAK